MPRDAPTAVADDAAADKEVDYHCRRCDRLVTKGRWRIAVNDGHEHVVFNPAGLVFRVWCFKEAPGAAPVGEASDVFTWFRGFAWRVAVCQGCGGHLGWMYEGKPAPRVFFGLIADSLERK